MIERPPTELDALFERERERSGPTVDEDARLRQRLTASLPSLLLPPIGSGSSDGGGVPTAGASTAAKAAAGASAAISPIPVGLTTLIVGAALGVAIDRSVMTPPEPRIVYVDRVVSAPSSSASTSLAVPSASALEAQATAARSTPTVAPPLANTATTLASRDSDLAHERAMLEIARSALARGDAAAALDELDAHARSHPTGRLREEREALAIQALVRLGRTNEANARAARFRRNFPTSILLPAVDAALSR